MNNSQFPITLIKMPKATHGKQAENVHIIILIIWYISYYVDQLYTYKGNIIFTWNMINNVKWYDKPTQ